LTKIFIFDQKFLFFDKNLIFDQNLDFLTLLTVDELIEQYGKKIHSSRKEPKPVQPVEPRLVELKSTIQINRANVSII